MPGTSFTNARSIPAFNVIVDLGQLPHAPSRRRFTIPSSTSTSSQSPPSRKRNGRNLSKTSITLSSIKASVIYIDSFHYNHYNVIREKKPLMNSLEVYYYDEKSCY